MVSTLKRQLNDDEKSEILRRFGRTCYANGHKIPTDELIQFGHIRAHSLGGDSELNNIAPMCGKHNRDKGQLSLEDFRVKLRLDEFFATGDKLTLRHLLRFLVRTEKVAEFGMSVTVTKSEDTIKIESSKTSSQHDLYRCPTTGWRYFYATLNIAILDSDDETDKTVGLQPRYLIADKVFSLYRHFSGHPVLQPSVGRISDSRVRLFDGQHKIAALLLNGRQDFECKIYIDPDLRLLNDTNILAHDAFAQTRFYSSIMMLKLGAEFAKDFDDFKNSDESSVKSEATFVTYMLSRPGGMETKATMSRRFRSHLYRSVLTDSDNTLFPFVSTANRSTHEQPITMDMLEKSIFSNFLFRDPTSDSMTSDSYRRDDELKNMVQLCNILVEEGLGQWNPKATADDLNRVRLQRIFGSKSMMAWSELLWDAVCARLDLTDTDDRIRVFYRPLSQDKIEQLRKIVRRLYEWQRWSAPKGDPIDGVLSDKKTSVKTWLRDHGLTTGFLMGASV